MHVYITTKIAQGLQHAMKHKNSGLQSYNATFWYICFEKWLALDLKFMELHDEMTVEIFLLRDLNLIGIGQIRI